MSLMSLSANEFPTTHQCLKDLNDKCEFNLTLAKTLAKEDVPFDKRSIKEISSLLRRNTQNLSELILFFDGLHKYALDVLRTKKKVEVSALFNFLMQQFSKSDFMSIGPVKVHNGIVSKFSAKKDTEVHQLIVELVRIKTELEMLIDGSLPPVCLEKFNQILFSSINKSENVDEGMRNLNDFAMENYMRFSSESEERQKLKVPKTCSDCPESPTRFCKECEMYRCQFCSQRFHRNLKTTHDEIDAAIMKKNQPQKMQSTRQDIQKVIAAEEDLALIINRENPWDERMLQQQTQLDDSSSQIRVLRELILKERSLFPKGVQEEEISKAFTQAKGDPQRAFEILSKKRQKSLDLLRNANITKNVIEKLTSGNDVARIVSEASQEELSSTLLKLGQADVELEPKLKASHRDKQFRYRLAYAELFPYPNHGWERSRFLVEVLDYGLSGNKGRPDHELWWREFDAVVFNDLVAAIGQLKELNFNALIESPLLSLDCCVCMEKHNKNSVFKFACKCEPICGGCLMGNLQVNVAEGDNLLTCFEKCFKNANDKKKMEEEHSRLYNHLQALSLKNESYKEIFEKFERLLTQKTMESLDFFHCPNPICDYAWVIDEKDKKRRIRCPMCEKHSCKNCRQLWRKQHKNVKCVDYTRWLQQNFPEEVANPIDDMGGYGDNPTLKCPECKTVYVLERGGCLHFTCQKCKFEFCGFCYKPFHKPSKNPCNTCATSKGLHAHHPRNCPFYTRDYWRENQPKLIELLGTKGLTIDDILPKNAAEDGCKVQITNDAGEAEDCDKQVKDDCQGYCEKHYVELLCGELFKRKDIDPADVMTVEELHVICNREDIEYEDEETADDLRQSLRQECPLDED